MIARALPGLATLLCLLGLAGPTHAFECPVVGVSDGDTLKVRCPDGLQTLRLAEIDAPEKNQPFGQRAKQALAAQCFGQLAEIAPQATDRYGRTVARVRCAGRDASVDQVELGLAWVYDRYVRDTRLYAVQAAARERRDGLWSDPEPIPPWEWRKTRLQRRSP